ncbi:uncharacterized protein [Miscanthus floridulus]|uniref:uncharacterized protein n=1 Tax=Miscanthus floridulus TaxID=154761 RepID=UPI00345A5168
MAVAAAASMGYVRGSCAPDVVEEVDQPILYYIANRQRPRTASSKRSGSSPEASPTRKLPPSTPTALPFIVPLPPPSMSVLFSDLTNPIRTRGEAKRDACLTRCSFIEMDLHSVLTGGVRAQATKHADRWICDCSTT